MTIGSLRRSTGVPGRHEEEIIIAAIPVIADPVFTDLITPEVSGITISARIHPAADSLPGEADSVLILPVADSVPIHRAADSRPEAWAAVPGVPVAAGVKI